MTATTDQIIESYELAKGVVENLSDHSFFELLGGAENDIDNMLNAIAGECFGLLYGSGEQIKSHRLGYLDSLSKDVEESFRCESLNYFIASVLDDFDVAYHHLEWGEMVRNYQYFCVLAARDHGKSFFFSNAYPIWLMYRFNQYPNNKQYQLLGKRILLFSFSMEQGKDLLEILKDNIENNSVLKDRLFPDRLRDGWGKEDVRLKTGSRLTVKSFGSSVRGAHPGTIIVDDGLTDAAIYSSTQREKLINYFHSVLMNAIVPKGQVAVIGTPFHSNDLYGDLKKKKMWHVREYPAVFPNGKLLWEGRYNFQALMDKKESQGNIIFSREILCKPITSDSTIFPYEIIKKSLFRMEEYTIVNNPESHPIKFSSIVIGCDFAISANVQSDYSVFITLGIDEFGNRWLLNMFRKKGLRYKQQISKLKALNANFRPDLIMMETNQMQQIYQQEAEDEDMPVDGEATGTNKYDLKKGLPSLSILFDRGKVKFPQGNKESRDVVDLIISEFTSVAWTEKGLEGVGEHDDIPMAFWQAEKAARRAELGFDFDFI